MHSKCIDFFSFKFFLGVGGEIFFIFPLFPTDSHPAPNIFLKFPLCSPRVFPIVPCFDPICFAQNPPLLTYLGGPKGDTLHLSLESSILGSLHSFNCFLRWANQIGSLEKTKKLDRFMTHCSPKFHATLLSSHTIKLACCKKKTFELVTPN